MIFEIRGPRRFVAAFESAKREGNWWIAECPDCGKGPGDRKLRAGIYKGRPWWGCMRCHCEKEYKDERNHEFERLRMQGLRGTPQDDAKKRYDAVRLFEESKPVRRDDFVHRYLEHTRGLSLQAGIAPADLRAWRVFNLDLKERGIGTYPLCMIAAVRSVDGSIIAAHRTYLYELPDQCVVKLSDALVPDTHRVQDAKKSLGSTLGGAIRLGIDSDEIGIAEGIETALGLAAATGLVCWSTVSSAGMSALELPQNIKRVVIGPDIGDKKRDGIKAAHGLRNRLLDEARRAGKTISVEILNPPIGCNDWAEKPRAK